MDVFTSEKSVDVHYTIFFSFGLSALFSWFVYFSASDPDQLVTSIHVIRVHLDKQKKTTKKKKFNMVLAESQIFGA